MCRAGASSGVPLAPRPPDERILARVTGVYDGSDADATKTLYAELQAIGPVGGIAVNLLRACKASERAKKYRGGVRGRGSYRAMAYDKKNWSIEQLCKALELDATAIRWGWGIDSKLQSRDPHPHVLYVDLPTGQVSFHSGFRGAGPDYWSGWDGVRGASSRRIGKWVAMLMDPQHG